MPTVLAPILFTNSKHGMSELKGAKPRSNDTRSVKASKERIHTNNVENGAYRGAEKEERNGHADKAGLQLASIVGVFSNDNSLCRDTRNEVSSTDRKSHTEHEHAIRDTNKTCNDG
jgi:hypothetical protein